MASKIISGLLGAIIGAALCAVVLTARSRSAAAAVEAARGEQTKALSDLQNELEVERTRVKALREEADLLAKRALELNKQVAAKPAAEPPAKKTGFAALFGGDGTNDNSGAFSGMMKAAMDQQIEGKISGMKTRLNLTPEQEAAVREILNKEMHRSTELAQKMLKGEMTMEEMQEESKKNANPVSEKDQIKALLTADQQEAYDAFEKEEQQRMARLMANSELLQLQGALHLDEAQQDKVYAVLAEQMQSQFGGADAGFDLGKMSDKKAEALKGVLTAEQFEQYKKFQEQQQKLIESFMPKSATNGGVRASVIVRPNP